MNTLFLLVGAFLVLSPSKSTASSAPETRTPEKPPAPKDNTGTDLGAAFGAFVGSLIAQYSK